MNGRNGYADGYGYSESNRYDRSDGGYGSSNSNLAVNGYSGGRDRRPGGYGGFYNESSQEPSPSASPERRRERLEGDRQNSSSRSRTRDTDSERRPPGSRDGRARGETSWMASSSSVERSGPEGAKPVSSSGGSQAMEDILQAIQRDWGFVASDDCVPVQVALQLMDTSTLGKADREPDFLNMNQQIQKTLKSVVNEHHQGFNSSIGTYHKIQSNIQSSQNRVRNLKHALEDAKAGLLYTKPELKGLATSSQKYDDLIQLFSQIQEIQSLPEKLESRISDKRFLGAVEVLHDAFRLLRRSELENIGALADIRAYFANQEISLTDILIEELHDHLYLKSPYCSNRWKLPAPEGEVGTANASSWTGVATWEKPVYAFLGKLDATAPLVEDASRNPEADTFYYIRLLIEALNKMGHLDIAVDRIEQRLPVELFAVVDKTNAEVDARHPNLGGGLSSRDSKTSLPTEAIEKRGHVLTEFLWTLYAKFEAIAEGHRVLHDAIAGIVEREGIPKNSSLTGGFKELWKLYQSEIRSLLHDYLATDGESSFRFREEEADAKRQIHAGHRDRNKKLFKLSETEQNTEMQAEQDELDEILKTSVPGLVSKTRQKFKTTDSSRDGQGNSGTGHKILIEPSVFNMSLLLPPSLFFIQRLKDIVPVDADIALSTLTSFLDDFLVNVFLPQLDETVTDLCTLSFIAPDAFTEDPQWSKSSPRPVFKGTVKFMSIIWEFSKMLSSIPHDQAFTQLLISQIVTYYDKCCGWYKAIVTKVSPRNHGQVRLKAAAEFAESGDIHDTVQELWEGPADAKKELIDKEIELLLKRTDEVSLEPYDIISDPKTVVALSLLYNSMQWLASHLAKLRRITASESREPQPETRAPPRRWTLIGAMKSRRDSISQPVYLPLNHETANVFDTTLQSLRNLASTALFALHIDIRCGVIHMLTRTMAGPNPPSNRDSEPTTPSPNSNMNWWHILVNQPTAASPTILELNNDLIAFDTNISSYLGPAEHWFITSGLARFIDQAFVSSTRHIGAMNENGALRLQLDVLVLQQNLKNIIIDPTAEKAQYPTTEGPENPDMIVALPRSAKFLDWFLDGAEKTLEYAKDEKELFAAQGEKALAAGNGEPLTYDELKVLIDLCFSEILRGPRGADNREDFMAAKKASADALLKLNEIMWDSK
ncbi:probable exocyst complex component sec8 [Aspergillus lentulus]|uniref:Exocyst complex component Sec8 n=1 Tax=Aspergillus lentulus TaxID=293939 RepID=A0ABQ0ZUA9_ASPLE|nr:probable exocyst complex component sec8 [Aspergillus lentulus]GFF68578.1 probable exocyst complex component sec8 [Aspergillus lentulus]GFF74438.1 probable exocyst complex component sec8 [Aspergillus lentulus]